MEHIRRYLKRKRDTFGDGKITGWMQYRRGIVDIGDHQIKGVIGFGPKPIHGNQLDINTAHLGIIRHTTKSPRLGIKI